MPITVSDAELRRVRAAGAAFLEAATSQSFVGFRLSAARTLRQFLTAERAACYWAEDGVQPWVSEDFSAKLLDEFAAHPNVEGDGTSYIGRLGGQGYTTRQLEAVAGLSLPETEFGERWFNPERLREGAGFALNVGYRGYCSVNLVAYRGRSRSGLWGEQVHALLSLLEPAFMAAVHVQKSIRPRQQALGCFIDLLPDGIAILPEGGTAPIYNARLRDWIAEDRELEAWVRAAGRTAVRLTGRRNGSGECRLSARRATRFGAYLVSAALVPAGLLSGAGAMVAVSRLSPQSTPDRTLIESFSLTSREIAVCRLLIRGVRNKGIAEALTISPHTARHHTEAVYRKVGVTSRGQLAARLLDGLR